MDDAIGQQQAAAAAVSSAKANVEQAQLNLGYTTITTPVTGLSSYAQVQEGSYVSGANSLLTYVAQIDTLWVNFSVSENDMLRFRTEKAAGLLRMPTQDQYLVDVVLADGSIFPHQGRITFANADYNVKTGTYLLRATIPNPDADAAPGPVRAGAGVWGGASECHPGPAGGGAPGGQGALRGGPGRGRQGRDPPGPGGPLGR